MAYAWGSYFKDGEPLLRVMRGARWASAGLFALLIVVGVMILAAAPPATYYQMIGVLVAVLAMANGVVVWVLLRAAEHVVNALPRS